MADQPPPSAGGAPNSAAPGIPHYEKLRRELRDTIQKKRNVDQHLAALEANIARMENAYLEETPAGNLVKGFDNYIKGSSASTVTGSIGGLSSSGPGMRRKAAINDQDRIFSRSAASVTPQDIGTPQPTQPPSHRNTPSLTVPMRDGRDANGGTPKAAASSNKKKRVPDRDGDEANDKAAVRNSITYGRSADD